MVSLTFWQRNIPLVNVRCDCEKTECCLKLWVKNVKSNGWPFKSQLFFRVHWLCTSGTVGLKYVLCAVLLCMWAAYSHCSAKLHLAAIMKFCGLTTARS